MNEITKKDFVEIVNKYVKDRKSDYMKEWEQIQNEIDNNFIGKYIIDFIPEVSTKLDSVELVLDTCLNHKIKGYLTYYNDIADVVFYLIEIEEEED